MQYALLPVHSPLENTPHNTCNGDHPITCGNRHCPKCQMAARDRWVAKRQTEVLPVGYFHVVFTLPHELSALALQNKKEIYRLLLQASADTLLEVAANPKHLGAAIGFLSILHTWGQNLLQNPHS